MSNQDPRPGWYRLKDGPGTYVYIGTRPGCSEIVVQYAPDKGVWVCSARRWDVRSPAVALGEFEEKREALLFCAEWSVSGLPKMGL